MNMKPQIFLIDDQTAVIKALTRLLNSASYEVSSFEKAQDFLKSDKLNDAGCIILDLAMPVMDGLALQRELSARDCSLPIIFLSGHGNIDTSVLAMKRGAFDFLTKPVNDERLISAIKAAFETNQQQRARKAELNDIQLRLASLTPREREVLDLVVEGHLNKQVASILGIAEKTIKIHRARVMAKMKVRTISALVRLIDNIDF